MFLYLENKLALRHLEKLLVFKISRTLKGYEKLFKKMSNLAKISIAILGANDIDKILHPSVDKKSC